MEQALGSQSEWTRAVIFDGRCSVHATSGSQVSPADLQVMTTAFKDKDTTFGLGVNIAGVNYEVHRFYPDEGLIYGRTHAVDPREGEGFCLARATQRSSGEEVYALITYKFPVLSAKAVPDLQNFLKQWIVDK